MIKINQSRHDKVEILLGELVSTAKATADLLQPLINEIITTKYDSYKKARRRITGYTYHLEMERREAEERAEYQRFQNSLQYLKKEGFITGQRQGHSLLWHLTKLGRSHLEKLKTRRVRYEKEKTDAVFVVSYDIPEQNGRERKWVREVLKFLNFDMVHQSVWIGNCKIPEDFIHDLRRKGIFSCLHVFEVGRRGTLTKLQ